MNYKLVLLFSLIISLHSCEDKQTKSSSVETMSTESKNISTEVVKKDTNKKILFFGDSLTAGYQLEESQSFPSLIQERIDSLGLEYSVINAGLSGETTSGGKNRIDWVLRQEVDIFVLELGANDMLRGLELSHSKSNLEFILDKVKEAYPRAKIIIAGMMAPPNLGADYANKFNALFPNLAKKYKASLIPFLLDGVAGQDHLNLKDGIHPNAKGQYVVRDNVWKILEPVL